MSFQWAPTIYNDIICNKEVRGFLIVKLHNHTTEKFAFRMNVASKEQREVHTDADGTTSLPLIVCLRRRTVFFFFFFFLADWTLYSVPPQN